MNPELARALANGQPVGGLQQVHIPSQSQKEEIELVRGMQVRTQAAAQATQLLAGKAPQMDEWRGVATAIEVYILGTADVGTGTPPV